MVEDVLGSVVAAVSEIRIPVVRIESEVVSAIKAVFDDRGIKYKTEVKVAPRDRVDLLVEGGIVVEVKKGKPHTGRVAAQVRRYAASDMVRAVVLVSERGLIRHIDEAHGKPVKYVALSKNWGLTT